MHLQESQKKQKTQPAGEPQGGAREKNKKEIEQRETFSRRERI
jgi:hypothetical protein